ENKISNVDEEMKELALNGCFEALESIEDVNLLKSVLVWLIPINPNLCMEKIEYLENNKQIKLLPELIIELFKNEDFDELIYNYLDKKGINELENNSIECLNELANIFELNENMGEILVDAAELLCTRFPSPEMLKPLLTLHLLISKNLLNIVGEEEFVYIPNNNEDVGGGQFAHLRCFRARKERALLD
uniref:Uncharacterized protein n=1 Tax=Meloidogyne javanica TaxID=6303 RepID=A0A915M8P4_MELJA